MAAVALPPSPRLRLVPSVEREESARTRRAHLQLVTDSHRPELVSELTQLGTPSFEKLAPAHPAVRAHSRRQAEKAEARPVPQARVSATRLAADTTMLTRVLVRIGLVAVFFALVVAVWIIASGFGAPVAGGVAVVQEGQSLWDVAVATGATDVASTVEDIIELNSLSSSTVTSGQQLLLPAQ